MVNSINTIREAFDRWKGGPFGAKADGALARPFHPNRPTLRVEVCSSQPCAAV